MKVTDIKTSRASELLKIVGTRKRWKLRADTGKRNTYSDGGGFRYGGENMIRAVIFDLDGTLTNTLQDIADAMNYALAVFGLPAWKTDEYRYLVGDGVRMLAKRAVRDRADLENAVMVTYQKQYGTHSAVKTDVYPGTHELLLKLKESGVKTAVLSNKPDADTKHVVAHYFPEHAFDLVRGQTDDIPVKPAPDGALLLARMLGIIPAETAYIGDTSVDMTTAVRAGMKPFGALWGFRDAKELTDSGAVALLKSPMDLIGYLQGKNA